ncbi:MAG: chromosomal replication initiator protein DnaA [Brevinema sp.]
MDFWNSLLTRIPQHIDSQLADTILHRISLQEIQNDSRVVFQAEDEFTKGWFEKNGIPVIAQILKEEQLVYELVVVTTPKDSVQPVSTEVSLTRRNKSAGLHLSSEFTLELFIGGQCNEFPRHAAASVLKGGSSFNPLVISGPTGSGKTHLAQAIAHEFVKNHPDKRVVYATGEEFMNDFIKNLQGQGGSMNHFRDTYRHCDVLIIDDIQLLSGKKEGTTTELGNIFDKLINRGVPMVFTSNRTIRNIKDFDERLAARLDGGLSVELVYPSFETRCAILMTLAQKENISIDNKVLTLIAETLEGDVRQLKSMLFKIAAYADLKKSHISMKMATEFLSDKIQIDVPKDLSIPDIQKVVAKFYGVTLSNIKSDSKLGAYTLPRQVAMYLANKHTKNSSTEIGQLFGKSHSTVLRSAQKIEDTLPKSMDLRKQIDKILIELTGSHR